MKRIIRYIVLAALLVCLPALISNLYADQPPDPGGGPGGGDPPVGGGSPLGGGLFVMALYSLVYGIRKIQSTRNKLMD